MTNPTTWEHIALAPEQNDVTVAVATAVFEGATLEPVAAARADFDVVGYDTVGSERETDDSTFGDSDVWGEAHAGMREALVDHWPDIEAAWVALNLND